MFKLGQSFILPEIQLDDKAKPLQLIWVDLSNWKLEAPSRNLNYWRERNNLKGYWLSQYLVTQAQWQAVAIPPKKNMNNAQTNYAATGISWIQAMQYCRLLNLKYKEQIPLNYHFSLPTEGYWIHTCKGDKSSQYYNLSTEQLEASRNSEVGQGDTNSWGFHDMLSNVKEWCYDIFDECKYVDLDYVSNVDNEDAAELRSLRGWQGYHWQGYSLFNHGGAWEDSFISNMNSFRVCLRPIFDWPNCDLNDPLLIEEGINMLE